MRYVSTRGAGGHAAAALLGDPARRARARRRPRGAGELSAFHPVELAALRPLDYRELAFAVLSRFTDDIPALRICRRSSTAPTRPRRSAATRSRRWPRLEPDCICLRVSNGPTLAFKDIALQLLGNLFEYVLAKQHATLNILGATSGDTGARPNTRCAASAACRCSCCRPRAG